MAKWGVLKKLKMPCALRCLHHSRTSCRNIRNTAEEIEQKARRASHSTVALGAVSFDFDESVEDEIIQ